MAQRNISLVIAAAAAFALTASPASAQLTRLPPRTDMIAQIVDTYALEIRDAVLVVPGRRSQLELRLTRVQAGAAQVTGTIGADLVNGYVDANSGQGFWVRHRNGQPIQAFVAQRHVPSQGWTGVMYALTPGPAGARTARNAYGFRAVPGRSFGGAAPPLPANPGVSANPLVLSGAVERWFPLQWDGAERGVLRITIGANGAVTGQLGPVGAASHPDRQVRGHYAGGAGSLVFVYGPASKPAGVFFALLSDNQPMQGDLHRFAASGGFATPWTVGPAHLFASRQRLGECLAAEGHSTESDAALRTMNCAIGDRHLTWGFVPPANSGNVLGAPAYRMVSLRSGLCAFRPPGTDLGSPFRQQPCVGNSSRADLNANGLYSTPDGNRRYEYKIRADQVGSFPAVWFEYVSTVCPGVSAQDPIVRFNCADNNSYWTSWR